MATTNTTNNNTNTNTNTQRNEERLRQERLRELQQKLTNANLEAPDPKLDVHAAAQAQALRYLTPRTTEAPTSELDVLNLAQPQALRQLTAPTPTQDTDLLVLQPIPPGGQWAPAPLDAQPLAPPSTPGAPVVTEPAALATALLAPLTPGQTLEDKELTFQLLASQWGTLDDAAKSALLTFVGTVEDPELRGRLVGHVQGAMAPPPVSAARVGQVAATESEAVMTYLASFYDPNVPSDELPPQGQLYVSYQLLHALQTDPEKYQGNLDLQGILNLQRDLMSNPFLAAELDRVRYEATHNPNGTPKLGEDGLPIFPTNAEIDAWADYLKSDDFAWQVRFAEFPDDFVRQNLSQFAHIVGPDDPRVAEIQEAILQHAMTQLSLDNLSEDPDSAHAQQVVTDMLTGLGYSDAITGTITAAVDAALETFPTNQTMQGLADWLRNHVSAALVDEGGEIAHVLSESGFFDGVATALAGASFAFTVANVNLTDGWGEGSNYAELGAAFFSTLANGANTLAKAGQFFADHPQILPWHSANPTGLPPADDASFHSAFSEEYFDAVESELEMTGLGGTITGPGAPAIVEGAPLANSERPLLKWVAGAEALGKWAGVVGEVFNFGARVGDIYNDIRDGAWGHLAADTVGAGLSVAGGANLLADQLFAEEAASLIGGPVVGLGIAVACLGLFFVEELVFGEDDMEKAARPLRLWKS